MCARQVLRGCPPQIGAGPQNHGISREVRDGGVCVCGRERAIRGVRKKVRELCLVPCLVPDSSISHDYLTFSLAIIKWVETR